MLQVHVFEAPKMCCLKNLAASTLVAWIFLKVTGKRRSKFCTPRRLVGQLGNKGYPHDLLALQTFSGFRDNSRRCSSGTPESQHWRRGSPFGSAVVEERPGNLLGACAAVCRAFHRLLTAFMSNGRVWKLQPARVAGCCMEAVA